MEQNEILISQGNRPFWQIIIYSLHLGFRESKISLPKLTD